VLIRVDVFCENHTEHTHTVIFMYIYIYIYRQRERERERCGFARVLYVKASGICSYDSSLNGQLLFVAVTIPLFTHNLAVASPLDGADGDIPDCIH